jgi:hypothetical protein
MLASGMTMRRIAKVLGVSKHTVEQRMGWLARIANREHLAWLKTPEARTSEVQFDEMETFEHTKCKPLSISLAVDGTNGKIIDTEVAYMRCKGHLAKISRNKYSWTLDTRQSASESVFQTVKKIAPPTVHIITDKKTAYVTWIGNVLPRADHDKFKRKVNIKNSYKNNRKQKQKTFEPLFYLNMACAKIRADLARMRRRTWTTTKKMERLQDQLLIYTAWVNGYQIC